MDSCVDVELLTDGVKCHYRNRYKTKEEWSVIWKIFNSNFEKNNVKHNDPNIMRVQIDWSFNSSSSMTDTGPHRRRRNIGY